MDEYIGDGVYLSFDGYQVWIAVNDHRNKVVAIEPMVAPLLISYLNKAFDRKPEKNDADHDS